MAEIMHDKSMSVANMLALLMVFFIAVIPPLLVEAYGQSITGYLFLLSGLITLLATVFIYFFMKETRGKSQKEIQQMF